MLTVQELKKLSAKELNEEFAKASKNSFRIKFEVNTGVSKANNEISKLRKYKAQIRTVQRENEIKEKNDFKTQNEIQK